MDPIGSTVITGAKWSSATQVLGQVAQFGVGLVLARLLVPEEFGLVASVYVLTGFAVIFFETGLGAALIHERQVSERDLSTVFWVNIFSGVVFAALLTACATPIADFYDQPELRYIAPLVGLSFTLAFGRTHGVILQRQLRFKTVAKIGLFAALVGHSATLVGALLGAGAYALVLGPLITAAMTSTANILAARWRPRHFIAFESIRRLWPFAGPLIAFNAVDYWGKNADALFIGRLVGAAPLGLYNRAYNLMLLPINQISVSLGRVMFPALSALNDDPARMRAGYLRALRVINAIAIPALLGLAVVAPGLVPLLWGDNWGGAVPLLQILCLAGLPQCLSASVTWLYQATGRTRTMLWVTLLGSTLGVALMVGGLHWGAVGIATAVALRYWVEAPFALHIAGKSIGLQARTALLQAAPSLVAGVAMATAVWFLPDALQKDRTDSLIVVLQVALGAALYPLALLLLSRRLLSELWTLLRNKTA